MQKTQNFFVHSLQFDDSQAPLGKKTLALLTSYTSVELKEAAEEHLPQFVEDHKDWCETVCSFILKRKGLTFDNFTEDFPMFEFDAAGITIWARCYRRHVAIFFNYKYWCTRKDRDLNKCDIYLLYRGNSVFENTRQMNTQEYVENADRLARIQAIVDERELARKAKKKKRKLNDSESELDLEETLEAGKPVKPPRKSRKPAEVTARSMTTRSRSRENNQKTLDNMQNPPDVQETEQEKEGQKLVTENNTLKCSVSLTVMDVERALKALKNPETVQEDNVQKEHKMELRSSKPKPNRSKLLAAAKLLDKAKSKVKGSWRAAEKKRQKEKCLLKVYMCPLNTCDQSRVTKKGMAVHVKLDHKKFRYKCRYCIKSYQNIISRYKHELYHVQKKPYSCTDCEYSCMFPSELKDHQKTHTGEDKYPCTQDDCDRTYSSKRARNAHVKSHYEAQVSCEQKLDNGEECGQICVSQTHLRQHIRGMHGEGWTSPCGEVYSWPSTMYSHKGICDKCKKIAKKK